MVRGYCLFVWFKVLTLICLLVSGVKDIIQEFKKARGKFDRARDTASVGIDHEKLKSVIAGIIFESNEYIITGPDQTNRRRSLVKLALNLRDYLEELDKASNLFFGRDTHLVNADKIMRKINREWDNIERH